MAGVSVQQAMNIALSHQNAGRLEQAEAIYRQVLTQAGDRSDALHQLAGVAAQLGRGDAEAIARRALAVQDDIPETHSILGTLLWRQKRLAESIAAYEKALSLRPDWGIAYFNLAIPLADSGQKDRAIAALRKATSLSPDYAPAWYNLGSILHRGGQLVAAVECFTRAAELQPKHANTHNNLGVVFTDAGQFALAYEAFHNALALEPGSTLVLHNLGRAQLLDGQLDQAIESLTAALAPPRPVAIAANNLGRALTDRGQVDEAISVFAAAIEKLPDSLPLHDNLLFTMQYSPRVSAVQLRQQAKLWNDRLARPLSANIPPHRNVRDPHRPLRIGYISPDFREHCQSFFTLPLLSHHDHAAFEVHAYSLFNLVDDTTRRIQSYVDAWHDVSAMEDQELADRIRSDGIDILIDLTLHMSNNRLMALARKPAPVLVTWLGYPGSTGLETIDWRLSDPYLDPPGRDLAVYSERTWRLPDTFWCYQCPEGDLPVAPLPMLASGTVTFGCLNNFCKVNAPTIQLWSQVLARVPGSRLILMAPPGLARRQTLEAFQHGGIEAPRIQFVFRQPRDAYLKSYGEIDLALDTFPYAGHTTSLDGLWMGVPVISLYGDTCVSRGGLSQLSNLGLADLATDQPETFVDAAVRLAADPVRLGGLRAGLRPLMRRSPLTDAARFAVNMEKAYRAMWAGWCTS